MDRDYGGKYNTRFQKSILSLCYYADGKGIGYSAVKLIPGIQYVDVL